MIDRRNIRNNGRAGSAGLPRAVAALALLAAMTQAGPAMAAAPQTAGFTIQISYSPRAAVEMTRRGESLGILVFYDGEPSRLGRRHATDEGTVPLGDETLVVAGRPQRLAISGRGFRADRLPWIQGAAMVTVNFYSARRTSRDNFLDCGLITGSIAQTAGRVHQVRCRLIGEH
jgi:hypothetical protein